MASDNTPPPNNSDLSKPDVETGMGAVRYDPLPLNSVAETSIGNVKQITLASNTTESRISLPEWFNILISALLAGIGGFIGILVAIGINKVDLDWAWLIALLIPSALFYGMIKTLQKMQKLSLRTWLEVLTFTLLVLIILILAFLLLENQPSGAKTIAKFGSAGTVNNNSMLKATDTPDNNHHTDYITIPTPEPTAPSTSIPELARITIIGPNTPFPTATPTPTPAIFLTPTPSAAPKTILFQDNFNPKSPLWTPATSNWIVGVAGNNRGYYLRNELEGTIDVGDKSWKNYRVDLDISELSHVCGTVGSKNYIRVMYQDSDDYLELYLDEWNIQWFSVRSKNREELSSSYRWSKQPGNCGEASIKLGIEVKEIRNGSNVVYDGMAYNDTQPLVGFSSVDSSLVPPAGNIELETVLSNSDSVRTFFNAITVTQL